MAEFRFREKQKEMAIKGAVALGAVFFCYILFVQSAILQVSDYKQNIDDAQKRIELYRSIKELNGSLFVAENVLGNLQDRPTILGKLQEIAGRSEFDIQTLTPKTTTEGNYVQWIIDVDAKGSFFSLVQFLKGLEQMNPMIICTDISVLRRIYDDQDNINKTLQIHLVLKTYLKTRKKKTND